ncbi:MAG: UDP-glucose dehydrogenase family protein [Roseateles asaccharophilus]|uniref:UDP-glucose 6-dehydrogenase n=1 Tax=Roseateles asaccharophilus TaxID=582607 RepID=A0A4R6N2W6_9BURK|nr:UDP-glucose/GDP-mannose dehydrogenase family protein [Roseateles asaccharophilus]MDN3545714.1 UDP-glucose/GDP-mannose dehydrogenase family protein [Roseateles asaccharophilus]TDP07582.1 UDP-glucose dehydrogenase [Roseateles asaccharophilus]
MKATVIGSGYVGLVTGACLADVGNDIVCLDIDTRKIAMLEAGDVPIYEPGLKELIERNARAGRLRFTTDVQVAVTHGDLLFIAVGTPPGEDGSADLQHVLSAARGIGKHLRGNQVVVNKSTVPVGTVDLVRNAIQHELAVRGTELRFCVLSNPEFLKEGAAIDDFMRPDRIVIGGEEPWGLELLRALYAPFERNHPKVITMDARSAELTKYAANAMLATRISFMNELALLADQVNADIDHVRRGIGSDPRIGTHFLYAGCGYGGSCFPKDVQALLHTGQKHGQPMRILDAVEKANEHQKRVLVEKLVAECGDLSGLTVAVWGLAFKPETDDMRAATSLVVVPELLARGAAVVAYDPVATETAAKELPRSDRLRFAESADAAVDGADALLIVTEWKEFRSPRLERLASALRLKVVVDGRNILDPRQARAAGLTYLCIGRP